MIKNDDSRIQKYLTPYKYDEPVLIASGEKAHLMNSLLIFLLYLNIMENSICYIQAMTEKVISLPLQ